ncbi:hypothetical protein RF11_02200 [Thelohanellus kitauei]|uniref:Uncharacterized protein n=1 Tax=Thelohanellus kitauei TaxID=669202 RepID=A0A0C2MP15_THEKT|nr:hypothetical protein RF11_02200 [Thelohanellus kitauei]
MGKETFDENEQSNQYFLKAYLVSLCIKEEHAFDLINSYSETSSNFGESRQYSFLKSIMRSIREANVKEYRSDCPADELTNTLLKRIKEIVEEARYGFVI